MKDRRIRPLWILLALMPYAAGCGMEGEAPAETPGRELGASEDRPSRARRSIQGEDWPRYRGVNFDAVSSETDWTTSWTAAPPQLWTAEIGTGFSGIAVAEGRAFTMGHAGGQDTVWCFDAMTGETLWKHSYPCALVDNLHEGGPAATPTVDGKLVYTISKEGHVFCFDAASGDIRWKTNVQDDLGVAMPAWGFACSPLIWRNLVILEVGYLAAYDKASGTIVWKSAKFKPGYGSAVSFRHDDDDLIATLNNEALLVARAENGAEIAKTKWETNYDTSSATPYVAGDTIFISTGYRRGCALFKLAGRNLEVVYESPNMSNHMNNCAPYQGNLFGFSGNSHESRNCVLRAIDHATGEIKWSERGLGLGTVMIAGGHLVILSETGDLVIAKASGEAFKEQARATILNGKCWTLPTLSHGIVYARNAAGKLVAVDLRR